MPVRNRKGEKNERNEQKVCGTGNSQRDADVSTGLYVTSVGEGGRENRRKLEI